jgi:3-hydroxy-9,10-secoandrosta-1,3,5(10)-triene-9,17-dione monooxygenase
MEPARHTVAAAPEPADIVARARALIPTLVERSREARRRRRIPDETIADMQHAGFFRVLQPKRWGGYEMDLHTFYDVELALGEGDMSTAWIYGVSGVHPWFMALLDDRAAQEVWGEDTSVLICSSLMPAGRATAIDGGYRLSGRWRYASCCVHCDWALLGALVASADGGAPEGRIFLLPRTDYTSVDTWEVSGLQATGSWDVIVEDAFVPAYRSQSMLDNFQLKGPGQALNTSSLYRLPFGQIFVRGISTAALGALQGMLNAFMEYGKARVTRAGGRSAENPFVARLRRDGGGHRRDDEHAPPQPAKPARLRANRRDAAARGASALQIPVDGGHRALHAARRAHLQGDRRCRPLRRFAVRRDFRRPHGRAAAHFQSIRICRQQLGRGDVRPREQGFDALV